MTSLLDLHTTLKLLSDPTRLRVLALLAREELAVHELCAITGLAQSRISNHLAILKRSALVRDRREGSWSFHSLVEPGPRSALSTELFDAVIKPYADSEEFRADIQALEAVREQRRERSRATHDALAERWEDVGQDFARGSLRSELFAALAPTDLVVADLGCGAGYLTSFLAPRATRVIAVDHSSNMLDAARRRADRFEVEFRQGELEQLPLADAEVDAAFANLVWHHLADADRGAREVFRVVRPNGFVVVSDLLPHEEDWMRDAVGDLRLGMRPEVVVAALARAGFTALTSVTCFDCYRVQRPGGGTTDLPMFLVRGVRSRGTATKQLEANKPVANERQAKDSRQKR